MTYITHIICSCCLTESRDVQHVGNAPVAHLHLGEVLVPTLLHYLLQRLGHFSENTDPSTACG